MLVICFPLQSPSKKPETELAYKGFEYVVSILPPPTRSDPCVRSLIVVLHVRGVAEHGLLMACRPNAKKAKVCMCQGLPHHITHDVGNHSL